MYGEWKKRKRHSITEQRISTLLRRYPVKTVLQLLQEVAQSAAERIDWNAIVKNSTTGISNAREYQMLWRHLAYDEALIDQIDEHAIPLDDDSDLEFGVDASPDVSRESAIEASACVKALVASDYPIDSHVPNTLTVEAPLPINIPTSKVPSDGSLPTTNAMQGKNIIIPVSIEIDPHSSGTSGKKRPNAKSGAQPPQRKRKGWSTEDDLKLTAAVEKHGEQNWDCIAGGDFKNDITPKELSQRWARIKKREAKMNTETSVELSKARRAAARAIFLALEPKSNTGTKTTQQESRIASAPSSAPDMGSPESEVLSERPPTASMIKVAAGVHIATPADASSVIAPSQNAVHITTGPSSVTNSSTATMKNQLPSNTRHHVPTNAKVSPFPSTLTTLKRSDAKEAHDEVVKGAEVAGVSTSASRMNTVVHRHQVSGLVNVSPKGAASLISQDLSSSSLSKLETDKCAPASGISTPGLNAQGNQASTSLSCPVNHTHHPQVASPCPEVEENGKSE